MPLVNRLANDYDPTQGIAGGIRSLGDAMAQLPAIRARAALLQAEQGRQGAMSDEAEARAKEALSRAGLTDTQSQKGQLQIEGAKNIARVLSDPSAVTKDSMGNVIISAPAFQTILGEMAKTGTGANDIGGGLSKMLTTQNAPVQSDANRKNTADIAAAHDTAAAQRPNVTQATVPQGSSLVDRLTGNVIATAPGTPQKAPLDTETIRQDINPAYRDNTNAPPLLSLTNITRHIAGSVKPQGGGQLTPDMAKQYLQKFGGDKDKARAAARADGYNF